MPCAEGGGAGVDVAVGGTGVRVGGGGLVGPDRGAAVRVLVGARVAVREAVGSTVSVWSAASVSVGVGGSRVLVGGARVGSGVRVGNGEGDTPAVGVWLT